GGRTVLVADTRRTTTAERADHFLEVAPEAQLAALWALRALVKGIDLDPGQVERSSGVDFASLRDWAGRMTQARYGPFFYGEGLGLAGAAAVEAALALVRELNRTSRFVALTLGGPGNSPGFEAVSTWQTGFAEGVDFRLGFPRPSSESMPSDLLSHGEV